MQTPSLSNTDGYNLFVYRCYGNLYRINIMDYSGQFHNFEGVYSNLQAAVTRGNAVITNLEAARQNIIN